MYDLGIDPFERGRERKSYDNWFYRRAFIALPVQDVVVQTLATFKSFPPRQKTGSITIDQDMEVLAQPTDSGK